jgi:DNA-binding CsgD family transcriptional regulator
MQYKNKSKRYTKQDDQILRRGYSKYRYRELAKRLGRTEFSIKTRLRVVLGVKKREEWTTDDDKKLVQMVKRGKTYMEIANELDRSAIAVRQHAIIIGVHKNISWMDERKISFLVKNFKKLSNKQLSLRLGVPIYIVKTNLHHYGLRRDGLRVIKRNYQNN